MSLFYGLINSFVLMIAVDISIIYIDHVLSSSWWQNWEKQLNPLTFILTCPTYSQWLETAAVIHKLFSLFIFFFNTHNATSCSLRITTGLGRNVI